MVRAGWAGAATVPLPSTREGVAWTEMSQLSWPGWAAGPTVKTYACPEMARHTTPTPSPAAMDVGWTVVDTATSTRLTGFVAPKSGSGETKPVPLSATV